MSSRAATCSRVSTPSATQVMWKSLQIPTMPRTSSLLMGLESTWEIRLRSSFTVSNFTLVKRGRLAYFEPKSSRDSRRPHWWYLATRSCRSLLSTASPPSVISSSRASAGTSGYRLCSARMEARVEG